MIRLINKHTTRHPRAIDITRTVGSPLANPFSEGSRRKKIDQFKRYALEQMRDRNSKFYQAVQILRDWSDKGEVVIQCVCKPMECHGDFILFLVEHFYEQFSSPVQAEETGSGGGNTSTDRAREQGQAPTGRGNGGSDICTCLDEG